MLIGSVVLAMALVSAPEEEKPKKDQFAIGRALGAQGQARIRAGLWFGNLEHGPMTSSFDYAMVAGTDEKAPNEHIGVGTGILRDIGVELTIGDYDFAFGFLSDELFAGATDGIDNPVAATVLKQILGQIRSRAIGALFGTEAWLTFKTGGFQGPLDADRFGVKDGQIFFGGKNSSWDTTYFSVEGGTQGDFFGLGLGPFIRFTHFSMPTALEIPAEFDAPFILQTVNVNAFGFGLEAKGTAELSIFAIDGRIAAIPFTGMSILDYGPWGTVFGLLLEGNARVALALQIPIGDLFMLRPYGAFEVSVVSPVAFSANLDDLRAPSVVMPDWLLWGPQVGLEVRL